MERVGCLILHGFAGDVHEVLPLARFLQEQGYAIECPTLEGHGASRRHLRKSSRRDWLRSAEEAYKRLAMRSGRIAVIGFSMGGLLAIQLAARHPVSLLITLNTPYRYWDIRQALARLKEDFRPNASRYLRGLIRIPLSSMVQFRLLLSETKRLLPQVTVPCVILQGQRDDTVQSVSAELLRNRLGSEAKVFFFPKSGHLLLLDAEADEAIRVIHEALLNHFS